MNLISAMRPAQAHTATAAGAATPPVPHEGLAGLFLGLLGEIVAAGAPRAAGAPTETSSEADVMAAPASDAGGDESDVAASSALIATTLVVTQPVLPLAPVVVDSSKSGVTATATPPIDVGPLDSGSAKPAERGVVQAPLAATQKGEGNFGEAISIEKPVAATAPTANLAPAAPSMESVIQAMAARIGRSAERAFGGRPLDGPAVRGPGEGSAIQAIDTTSTDVEPGVFTRVAVNAATASAGEQSAGESPGGDFVGSGAPVPAKAEVNSAGGATADFGAETRLDFNAMGGRSKVSSGDDAVASATRNVVPESVSVREVGDVVVRSVHYLSGKTEEVMTVRLVPRSLGELQIAVRHTVDGVEVVLTAANAAAREALEGNLSGLREALSRGGVEAPRVTIQVASHFDASNQPAFGQQGQQGASGHASRQAPMAYREPYGSGAQEQDQQQPRRQRHDGRLNTWA